MHEYWESILAHNFIRDSDDLRVPKNMAVSVRRFADWSGTTFDERSMFRVRDMELEGVGVHNKKTTRIVASWEDIQSVTFSYKAPKQIAVGRDKWDGRYSWGSYAAILPLGSATSI